MDNSLQILQEIDKTEIAKTATCSLDDLSNHIPAGKASLNIIIQNIRSVYSNFNDFEITFSRFKLDVDIIILTECWLSPNKPLPH